MPTSMATSPVHLKPNAPVAERALLPGDPGRALRLAQHLLAAPMQVLNTNRGLWGYTGTAADGAPLTIQSTGMGGPSAAIVAEELIGLGARRLVRVGTCGLLEGRRELGSLLVAGAALCADGTSRALGGGERAAADARADRRARAAWRARRRSSPRPISSTTPSPRARRRGSRRARSRSRWRRPRCSRSPAGAVSRRAACSSSPTSSPTGERIGDDALHAAELRLGDAALAAL